MNRRFVVCIHDATPAYERETRAMIGDLAPILGRRLSFGVVPDWHGQWHLAAHPDYCHLVQESSAELLLHGADESAAGLFARHVRGEREPVAAGGLDRRDRFVEA